MNMQTLFNIYLELITMHHVGGEGRIPAEGVDYLLSSVILREKLSHQYKQLHCLLSFTLVTEILTLRQQKCWTK